MMHESGKSDTAIGAVKPANVAERSGTEWVEQRSVAEGNADQQPTCRTQSRAAAKTAQVDVSQELARIRRVASIGLNRSRGREFAATVRRSG
jgi:hypothetical protein